MVMTGRNTEELRRRKSEKGKQKGELLKLKEWKKELKG